ncbi:MAG TPA: uroporphyrinogen decarboxylase family protein [bacterium]|nr:uroporphyrinogen decarboxylase family protein [bacterium]HPN42790.1 uroporphyrinogen decarboxylase family protein [bacterium]
MTSRERVLKAVTHEQPDRVPVDLGSTPSSGISAIAYNRLKNHIKINPGPTRIYDIVQQLAQPDDALLDFLAIDVIDIGRVFKNNPTAWRDVQLADRSLAQEPSAFRIEKQNDGSRRAFSKDGTWIATMPANGTFFDQACYPYENSYPSELTDLPAAMQKVLWAALTHSPWDHLGDKDFWITLRNKTQALRYSTDKALMVNCGCNLFEWGAFLRRIDNFLTDLLVDTENVKKLVDTLLQQHLAFLEKVCSSVGDLVDICRFGDDLGMNSGPFMAPDTYQELFKPGHKILCDYVHSHSKMHTFLHSCGSIYKLLPDLIDAGFEIINPVQTSSADMNPIRLKQEFGRHITFWGGGCDTKTILNMATPAEVKAHVLERLEIFAPQGGFVFNPIHNILPEVPPENIMAMFAAIWEFNGE